VPLAAGRRTETPSAFSKQFRKGNSPKVGSQGGGWGILRAIPTPNQRSAMDDKEGQIDEMGEARDAQYALECARPAD
jgi:hypothetical protein